jgi:hypothetical protein
VQLDYFYLTFEILAIISLLVFVGYFVKKRGQWDMRVAMMLFIVSAFTVLFAIMPDPVLCGCDWSGGGGDDFGGNGGGGCSSACAQTETFRALQLPEVYRYLTRAA